MAGPVAPGSSGKGLEVLRHWAARTAFRRDLLRLLRASPHLVRDIGLDEALVRREVALPFWRAGRLRPGNLCLPVI